MADEIDLNKLKERYEPTTDPESGGRLDFLFALRPKPPAPIDQILVVEIKRGFTPDHKVRRVNDDEVNKFHSYVLKIHEEYEQNTNPPMVNGLMIANGYTSSANLIRRSLESSTRVKLEFQTWDSVIKNTRRLHTSWLEVTRSATNANQ